MNVQLTEENLNSLKKLVLEYKDIFAWTYKDMKGIPLELTQHHIELDTSIPLPHQAKYKLNPNYVKIIKQNIDKLLTIGFIQLIEEATWLSPIVVIPMKDGKLKIYLDFKKLNATTKKDLYPLPFTDEILNIVAGHNAYSFLYGYFGYHQISIVSKDKYKITFVTDWGAFTWVVMPFGIKNGPLAS